jgi:hypothetical protein
MTWMRRIVVGLGMAGVLIGCGKSETVRPPRQLMTPTSRLIYHGGGVDGVGVYTFCYKTDRVYMDEVAKWQVIANGCPTGEP